jgi:1-acyl-sn-glycerol-3-phosphate acyltransferase
MKLTALLRKLQSLSCLGALLVLFLVGDLILRFFLYPLGWMIPKWRIGVISSYMRFMGASVLNLVRLGGGSFTSSGMAPTGRPVLILMNHQSLLDIPIAVGVSGPYVPAFVTRRRYARFVPMVSLMLAMRRCPIVDPDTDPRGAIATLKAAARNEERGLLIFPEGHRSRDGQIAPFNTAGVRVILREKRMPVYLVVTDGCFVGRRLFDFLSNMHRIHGRTEVLGPWDPPAADGELEEFVSSLRDRMVGEIEDLRRGPNAGV